MNPKDLFKQAEQQRAEEKLDEAVASYEKAREEALKAGDRWVAAESAHMIGVIYYQKEEGEGEKINFQTADKFLSIALEEFKELGESELESAVLRDLGLLHLKYKDLSAARGYLSDSVEKLRYTKNLGHLGISLVKLGLVEAEEGRFLEAETIIKEGLENIGRSPDRFFESIAYYDLAKVYKRMKKAEDARRCAEKSLQVLDQIASPNQHQSKRKKIDEFLKELEGGPAPIFDSD